MKTGTLLTGVGLGAALAFTMDPTAGSRRRAAVRDRLMRTSRKARHGVDATARDLANRSRGIAATTRARLSDEQVADQRLLERVRARLGRACSHPRAIDVAVQDGNVTLRGPILAGEAEYLMTAVSAVRGVRTVANELQPRDTPEGVPSLQGGRRVRQRLRIHDRPWPPARRALTAAGIAATGMWLATMRR
jgi:osmotically-inducible protein OsmY